MSRGVLLIGMLQGVPDLRVPTEPAWKSREILNMSSHVSLYLIVTVYCLIAFPAVSHRQFDRLDLVHIVASFRNRVRWTSRRILPIALLMCCLLPFTP